MLLGRDLENSRDGTLVGVKGMPHHLCDVLVDEDDADVVPVQKLPVGDMRRETMAAHSQLAAGLQGDE